MKIEKLELTDGIRVENSTTGIHIQNIYFDSEQERDVVFKHWTAALEELKESKAIFRPVYETKDKDTQILKLRYTTPEEIIRVEEVRKEHFPKADMKLIMIYNEAERTFQNVNF